MNKIKPIGVLVVVLLAVGMYFGYTNFVKKPQEELVKTENIDTLKSLDSVKYVKQVNQVDGVSIKTKTTYKANTAQYKQEEPKVVYTTKKTKKQSKTAVKEESEPNQNINNKIPNF